MISPEVNRKLSDSVAARDFLLDAVWQINDQMDTIRFRGQCIEGTFDQRPDTHQNWSAITDPELHQLRIEDMAEFIELEATYKAYNHTLGVLIYENNIPLVANFLRDQVTLLSTQMKDPEDYKNIQRLSCLADDLSRAA